MILFLSRYVEFTYACITEVQHNWYNSNIIDAVFTKLIQYFSYVCYFFHHN